MRRSAVALLAILVLSTSSAHAQGRERERFHSQHWVYDDRFHHGHYYPALGYGVAVLPPGSIAITFRGGRYWYHSGVWFTAVGPGFVVASPPVGIVVPVLPPGYTTVYVGGSPYYYANDVYYVAQPSGGYVVAEPPATATALPAGPPPPQAPARQAGVAPQATPGSWYYCDSAKAYYPYVSECKEGWKPVPATPPPTR